MISHNVICVWAFKDKSQNCPLEFGWRHPHFFVAAQGGNITVLYNFYVVSRIYKETLRFTCVDARISLRECALLEVSLMVKYDENKVTPSFAGTFVTVTFDSESWIDADEDDSTLAGKGKCNSKEQGLKGFLQKNKILTSIRYFL